MKAKRFALLAIISTSAFAIYHAFAAPAQRSNPMLTCKLKLTHEEAVDPLAIWAELSIENRSSNSVEFIWTIDPLETMTVQIENLKSRTVETIDYSHRFSIVQNSQILKIESGKSKVFEIRSLLRGTENPIGPGKYRVSISLECEGRSFQSNGVDVTVNGE